MDNSTIEKIIKEVKNEKWNYWKEHKITDYLDSKNYELSYDELIDISTRLVEEDLFGLYYAITNLIEELASDHENYINLLNSIIIKIKRDLAQGQIIDALIAIGKSKSELGLKIAQMLLDNDDTAEYASFLIAGSSNKLFSKSIELVNQLLASDNFHHRVAAIRSLRTIYKETSIDDLEKLFSIFENAAKDESKEVNLESLEAFLDFYKINSNQSEKNIELLANSSSECKFSIAHRIWLKSPFEDKTSMKFLEICSKDSNINVKQRVCYALVNFCKQYPEQILDILANYIVEDGYARGTIGYVLEELGKVNAEKSAKIIISWLNEEINPRLKFHIPIMVGELASKSDKILILKPIFHLIESKSQFYNKGLDMLLEIISDNLGKDTDSLISQTLDFLKSFAQKQGIDVIPIIKNEKDYALICADIIHMLKYYSKDLDYQLIFKNCNEFPQIRDLFGVKWFEQKQKENNKTHSILKILEQPLPSKEKFNELTESIKNAKHDRDKFNDIFRRTNLMSSAMYLVKLENDLITLQKSGLSLKNYANNLRNEQQFDATLSEIDFVTPFVGKYPVKLEPVVKTKKLDAKIDIDPQSLYVEIISPKRFKPLDRLPGARGIPNRIKSKIYEEFKEQLTSVDSIDQPVIVAIDIGRSEVDYDFVQDYLLGSLKFTFYINTETHESTGTIPHRDTSDSMHSLDPATDIISAVICYKSRLYDDLRYRTEGKIFLNPNANVQLSRPVIKAIEDNLFSRDLE